MSPGFVAVETRCEYGIATVVFIQELPGVHEHVELLARVATVNELTRKLDDRVNTGSFARCLYALHVSITKIF
ncbi:hypothetical protein ACFSYD_27100 [Paracoccus aerius]|nr:hypothetical protein GCM10017322_39110 [Paracoccus aerius]